MITKDNQQDSDEEVRNAQRRASIRAGFDAPKTSWVVQVRRFYCDHWVDAGAYPVEKEALDCAQVHFEYISENHSPYQTTISRVRVLKYEPVQVLDMNPPRKAHDLP